MAFAVVAATNGGATAANATSSTINLPTGIAAGHLLVAIVTVDQNTGVAFTGWPTDGAGWTQLWAVDAGTNARQECRYKVADGSEGSSFALGHETNMSSHVTLRITGGHASTAPASASTNGSSTTPDPPSLNPASWDVEDTLWLAICGCDGNRTLDDPDPTNYTAVRAEGFGGNPQGTGTAVARRDNATASEDPGAYTISAIQAWVAGTIAVRPAAAAGAVLDGTAALALDASATLTTAIPLAATAALALEASATLITAIALTGTATLALDATAELTTGGLTDTEKLALMEWGLVWEPGLPLAPEDPFNQANKQQLLWGYPGVLWSGGGAAELDGSAALVLDAAAELTTAIPLTGSAALAVDATGGLTTGIPLAAEAALTLTVSGELTTAIMLAATATLALDAAADLAGAAAALTGAATLALDATGGLTTGIPLAATAALALDATGDLTTGIPLAGEVGLALDASATLTTAILLTGAADLALSAAADLAGTAAALAGSAALVLDATGSLTTAIPLSGAATLALDAAGSLTTGIPLSGSAELTLDAAGALTTAIPLTGAASVVLSASADLGAASAALDGQATLALSAIGTLTTGIDLAGAATLALDAAADLTTAIHLTGAAALVLTAEAELGEPPIVRGGHSRATGIRFRVGGVTGIRYRPGVPVTGIRYRPGATSDVEDKSNV